MNPENTPQEPANPPTDFVPQAPTSQEPNIAPLPSSELNVTPPSAGSNTAFKVVSIILLVLGVVLGFLVGVFINFGSCFKSDCNPVAGGAPIWIPIATLLVTIPLVVKAFKKKV